MFMLCFYVSNVKADSWFLNMCKETPYYCLNAMDRFIPSLLQASNTRVQLPVIERSTSCEDLSVSALQDNFQWINEQINNSYVGEKKKYATSSRTNFVVDRFGLMGKTYCLSESSAGFGLDVPAGFVDLLSPRYFNSVWEKNKAAVSLIRDSEWKVYYSRLVDESKCLAKEGSEKGEEVQKLPSSCFSKRGSISNNLMPIDYEAWKNLNIESAELWSALLSCSQSAEAARASLLDSKTACWSKVAPNYKSLAIALEDFALNHMSVSGSSSLTATNEFEYLTDLLYSIRNKKLNVFHSIHPILEQIILDLMLVKIDIEYADRDGKEIRAMHSNDFYGSFSIAALIKLKPDELCSSFGLWPALNQLLAQKLFIQTQNSVFQKLRLSERLSYQQIVSVSCHSKKLGSSITSNWESYFIKARLQALERLK